MLVFAASAEGVAAAIDVLEGKSAGITDAKSPLGLRVKPGTIFLARVIALPAKVPNPILKQVESFHVALGEHDGKSFYRASWGHEVARGRSPNKSAADGVASRRFLEVC